MFKKRLKKWNYRKRTYRKGSQDTATPAPATPMTIVNEDIDVEEVPRTSSTEVMAIPTYRQPSPLNSHAQLESILGSICSWSCCKLETYEIKTDQMSRYLASPSQPPIQDSRTMYRTFELVFDLWKRGRGDLAGMAARKGFYILEYVLAEDHPDLIWHVLDVIYDMIDKGHLQLLGIFLGHASALAESKLQTRHPLYRILQELRKCRFQTEEERQQAKHTLRQAWLRNVDLLSGQIGSFPSGSLWLYEQLIWDARTSLRNESDLKRKAVDMTRALEALTVRPGAGAGADDDPNSRNLRITALMLEFAQMDLKNKDRAEELAERLLNDTRELETPSGARFHAYASKMLARIHEGRHEMELAEKNLQFAIRKREAAHGKESNIRVVRDMWVLSNFYQRVGKMDEANQVATEAINRARRGLEVGLDM